jgi:hypothetical protein
MRIISLSGWLAVAFNPDQWSSTAYACLHHICLQWSYNGVGLSMCNLFLLQAVTLKINSALFCSGNKGRISRKVTIFFFGLFGGGDSTERITKMTHTVESCCLSHTYQSCYVCLTYIFTVYCCKCSTVATSSAGKSLTRSRKVSVLDRINRQTEWNLKNKRGTKLPRDICYFGNCPRKSWTNAHLNLTTRGNNVRCFIDWRELITLR